MTDVTTSDGVRLYAEATGAGLPVLFIHEFAADHRTWYRRHRDGGVTRLFDTVQHNTGFSYLSFRHSLATLA